MANFSGFLTLSKRYINSAKILLEAGEYNVAYYLAGYSVECLIKAVICKKIGPHEFPPQNANSTHYTHSIEQLIKTAGLERDLSFEEDRADELKKSYLILKDWNPKNLRYDPGFMNKEIAKNYIDEIKNRKGLIVWLNKYL